ncbi:MAG: CDP-alcohol phosphatidyltransferase family protein [Bacteroidia bacterium]|nr:CDP-alcohol phosphatidyltransferase family protein [Bacteroidia bacterium]
MDNQSKDSFKDSLKSWDTENWLDRYFYRPIAFKIALLLKSTSVTPNAVTIFSIFVGVGACLLFYPDQNLLINLIGFALLVFANTLDCVDGQLARMTGKGSQIGRILDGMTGDIWFFTFYLVMSLRIIESHESWGFWFFGITILSALSHLYQAGMVDYYKTLHLHFLKGGKDSEFEDTSAIDAKFKEMTWKIHFLKGGKDSEFEDTSSIDAKFKEMTWKKDGLSKLFLKLYYYYTKNQELFTPQLKRYINQLNASYPEGYTQEQINNYRERSLKLMPALDALTFNARSVVMLISLLLNMPWLYFIVEILVIEILVMNPLLYFTIYRHEKMCRTMNN